MRQKEEPLVAYYDDPAHFADLMNGWIYHGARQLSGEEIHEINTRYTSRTNKNYRSRYRDIAKQVQNIRVILIVGTEIQTYVDYSMPVRGMDYDAVEYKRQISRIKNKHKNSGTAHLEMSPINKEDRLVPAITLVLYLGEKPWDAADNLHEILDFSKISDEWKEYIQNYKVHVLDIRHTSDDRLMEFPEDIACMFLAIKYAGNKEKLSELIRSFPHFQKLDEETYDTIWNYVGNKQMLKMKKTSEKGGIDMRCAIDEIYEDGIAEGERRGISIGEERGISIGERRGEERGITIGEERGIANMLSLLKELGYSANDTKFHLEDKLHMSEAQAAEYIRKYWHDK